MDSRNLTQIIVISLLLMCGYIYLLQSVLRRSVNKSAAPLIAVILFLMYTAVSVVLLLLLSSLGSLEMALMGLLVLLAGTVLMASVAGIIRSFRQLEKGMLAVFILYLVGVAYISIFSRGEGNDTSIRMIPFASLTQARTASTDMLNHMLLNVAMFIPMGILFPMVCPETLSRWRYIAGIGFMSSVAIESTQLVLRLGQCDIDDIIANTLGAVCGYMLYLAYRRLAVRRDGAA